MLFTCPWYLGAIAGSSGQAVPEDLDGDLAALEGVGSQAGGLLAKARQAFASLHENIFPNGQAPSSLDELADLSGPDASAIGDFRQCRANSA